MDAEVTEYFSSSSADQAKSTAFLVVRGRKSNANTTRAGSTTDSIGLHAKVAFVLKNKDVLEGQLSEKNKLSLGLLGSMLRRVFIPNKIDSANDDGDVPPISSSRKQIWTSHRLSDLAIKDKSPLKHFLTCLVHPHAADDADGRYVPRNVKTFAAAASLLLRTMAMNEKASFPFQLVTAIDNEAVKEYDKAANTIGRGAFGAVTRAKMGQGTLVAIKTAEPGGEEAGMSQCEKSFNNEVLVLNQLRHPNIVTLLGVLPTPDPPLGSGSAMVLELLRTDLGKALHMKACMPPAEQVSGGGEELWDHLAFESQVVGMQVEVVLPTAHAPKSLTNAPLKHPKEGVWQTGLLFNAVKGIASGMDYIHLQDYAHNDLSPKNIFVTSDYVCKIGDFGQAHPASFRFMGPLGTNRYMSPQVIKASKESPFDSQPADVWAFGTMVLEIISRKRPFSEIKSERDDPFENNVRAHIVKRAEAVSEGEIDSVHDIPAYCPIFFEDLVKDCTNPNPEERPSFGEIVERLTTMEKLFKTVRIASASEEIEEEPKEAEPKGEGPKAEEPKEGEH